MAIKNTVSFKGLPAVDAYIRASSTTIHEGNNRMSFMVHYSATADDSAFDVAVEECAYDLQGANPLVQAYEYLKTLSGFVGSIDC